MLNLCKCCGRHPDRCVCTKETTRLVRPIDGVQPDKPNPDLEYQPAMTVPRHPWSTQHHLFNADMWRRREAEAKIDEALSASGYNASMAEKAFLIELIARII